MMQNQRLIPTTNAVRTERVTFRLTKDETDMLNFIADKLEMNRSDVIRGLMYDCHDHICDPDVRKGIQSWEKR